MRCVTILGMFERRWYARPPPRRRGTKPTQSVKEGESAEAKLQDEYTEGFRAVTERQMQRAVDEGVALKRVWELQNMSTKKFPDLLSVSVTQMELELSEHFKRHGKAKRSWMHLYLDKLTTAEEVDAKAEPILMKFQSVGVSLTPNTAGILVSLTYKTGSDVALRVFSNSSRYRIWPEKTTLLRLLHYYAKKGNVAAVRSLSQIATEKAVPVSDDVQWETEVYRAYANSNEAEAVKEVWKISNPDKVSTTTALNLLLKCAVIEGNVSKGQEIGAKVKQPNKSTEALLSQLKPKSSETSASKQ